MRKSWHHQVASIEQQLEKRYGLKPTIQIHFHTSWNPQLLDPKKAIEIVHKIENDTNCKFEYVASKESTTVWYSAKLPCGRSDITVFSEEDQQ